MHHGQNRACRRGDALLTGQGICSYFVLTHWKLRNEQAAFTLRKTNPGAKFYRFTSDQYGAFHIIAMNANASEAIYVLDGLLYHGSDLAIETHYVDTGGVSDMSFALCHLVGFQLVPRLRGLKDRKLYLFPGDTPPENLASLVGEPINVERIKANWNDILRLVTTIRSGQVRPSTLLAKLSAFPRQNGLALALRDIGRINRSIFLPQWWQNPEMRRNATAGLNKSEAQNTLARALFFNRLGELRDRTFESQFYRASGLNLLINAIVYWNTLYLEPLSPSSTVKASPRRPT
jgi:TnpA family transposase